MGCFVWSVLLGSRYFLPPCMSQVGATNSSLSVKIIGNSLLRHKKGRVPHGPEGWDSPGGSQALPMRTVTRRPTGAFCRLHSDAQVSKSSSPAYSTGSGTVEGREASMELPGSRSGSIYLVLPVPVKLETMHVCAPAPGSVHTFAAGSRHQMLAPSGSFYSNPSLSRLTTGQSCLGTDERG